MEQAATPTAAQPAVAAVGGGVHHEPAAEPRTLNVFSSLGDRSISSHMEFRDATRDDAERILRFWKESGATIGVTDQVEHIRRVATSPAAVLLLALVEDEIVGTLLGAYDGWRGNMYRLVVHPARRRQGVGRELVRRIEQVFAEWGVRRITVLVEVDRPWAAEFWKSVGYPRDEHIVRHLGILDSGTARGRSSAIQ